MLLICNGRRRGSTASSWSSRRVSHEQVGGASDWSGTTSARHWAIPSWPPSVQRNIGHILDHGDRPTPCSALLNFDHLSADSLLPCRATSLLDVAFHSYSSRTNWGRRQLNGKEIAGAMDLPLWFSTSALFGAWWDRHAEGSSIPLKPFQSLLTLWFLSSGDSPELTEPSSESTVEGGVEAASKSPGSLEDDFWIPELGKLLPGTWVEAGEVSDKAAKSDDAKIHTGLWDERIMLVLPGLTSSDLQSVRPLFYRVWCRKLVQCFGRFMRATHGPDWRARLFKLRRLRRLGAESTTPHRGGVRLFPLPRVRPFVDGSRGARR